VLLSAVRPQGGLLLLFYLWEGSEQRASVVVAATKKAAETWEEDFYTFQPCFLPLCRFTELYQKTGVVLIFILARGSDLFTVVWKHPFLNLT
jgi:hypothetical protein